MRIERFVEQSVAMWIFRVGIAQFWSSLPGLLVDLKYGSLDFLEAWGKDGIHPLE
jgi:hypothetical protein